MRAFYSNEQDKEITRMIAWENRFITNIASFKDLTENNETIESIKKSEILYISQNDFEILMKAHPNLKSIYTEILEEYNALHIRRFEALNTFNLQKKFEYLKLDFPHLIRELNDNLLSSFIGISRIHYVNNKHLL